MLRTLAAATDGAPHVSLWAAAAELVSEPRRLPERGEKEETTTIDAAITATVSIVTVALCQDPRFRESTPMRQRVQRQTG